jgi:hypothetical protein
MDSEALEEYRIRSQFRRNLELGNLKGLWERESKMPCLLLFLVFTAVHNNTYTYIVHVYLITLPKVVGRGKGK